jgi:hypothetical protein
VSFVLRVRNERRRRRRILRHVRIKSIFSQLTKQSGVVRAVRVHVEVGVWRVVHVFRSLVCNDQVDSRRSSASNVVETQVPRGLVRKSILAPEVVDVVNS